MRCRNPEDKTIQPKILSQVFGTSVIHSWVWGGDWETGACAHEGKVCSLHGGKKPQTIPGFHAKGGRTPRRVAHGTAFPNTLGSWASLEMPVQSCSAVAGIKWWAGSLFKPAAAQPCCGQGIGTAFLLCSGLMSPSGLTAQKRRKMHWLCLSSVRLCVPAFVGQDLPWWKRSRPCIMPSWMCQATGKPVAQGLEGGVRHGTQSQVDGDCLLKWLRVSLPSESTGQLCPSVH